MDIFKGDCKKVLSASLFKKHCCIIQPCSYNHGSWRLLSIYYSSLKWVNVYVCVHALVKHLNIEAILTSTKTTTHQRFALWTVVFCLDFLSRTEIPVVLLQHGWGCGKIRPVETQWQPSPFWSLTNIKCLNLDLIKLYLTYFG